MSAPTLPVAATTPPKDPWFALARTVLFELDPERAHDLALACLSRAPIQAIVARRYRVDQQTCTHAFGLEFDNAVGLAAGLDKNGDYIEALGALGFGSLELGTVTPRPQPGNPRPRLFRLPPHGALINRMGFNNKGVDHLARRLTERRYRGRIGVNIGKNADTPLERAADDYCHCFERVAALADYVTINVSSPNTEGLRDLQHGDFLDRLLDRLKNTQSTLATRHGGTTPLAMKLAPDLDEAALDAICARLLTHQIEGLIVTNTTLDRDTVSSHLHARERGGLSGAPLRTRADHVLQGVVERTGGKLTVIGVGGIDSGAAARHKRDLGADLVQLYSGFIFHGPALVRDCIRSTS